MSDGMALLIAVYLSCEGRTASVAPLGLFGEIFHRDILASGVIPHSKPSAPPRAVTATLAREEGCHHGRAGDRPSTWGHQHAEIESNWVAAR
jgi:hypothetical protein